MGMYLLHSVTHHCEGGPGAGGGVSMYLLHSVTHHCEGGPGAGGGVSMYLLHSVTPLWGRAWGRGRCEHVPLTLCHTPL